MKLPRVLASAVVALLPMAATLARQAVQTPEPPGPTIKVEVSVVNVLCTVRDGKGRLISNLEKGDFEIREDNKPQTILYFSRETKLPLTLGLLVDSSISQQRLIADERRAAAEFFEQVLGKQDAAFLISFDVTVDLLQNVTGSVDFLRQALGEIRVNSGGGAAAATGPFPTISTGGTHLYDAVYLASGEVLAKEVGRKSVVLITDGQDHGSKVSRDEAIKQAQRNDAIVYGILFVDRSFYGFGGVGYSGESVLKTMAEETGGRVFQARNDKELAVAFDQISTELRSQYSIGYSPTNDARDGSYRRIEVKTTGKGYRVQARKGYYAPGGG